MLPESSQIIINLLQNPTQVSQYLSLVELGLFLITSAISWGYKFLKYVTTPYRARNNVLKLISRYDYYVFRLLQDLEQIPKHKRTELIFYGTKRRIVLILLVNIVLLLLYYLTKVSFFKILIEMIWIISLMVFMIVGGFVFPLLIPKLSEKNIRMFFWIYFVSMVESVFLIFPLLKKAIPLLDIVKILAWYYGMITILSLLIWRLIKSELYMRYKYTIQRVYQNKLPFVIISTKNGLHRGYLRDIVSSNFLTLKTRGTFIPISWEDIEELEITPRFFIEP